MELKEGKMHAVAVQFGASKDHLVFIVGKDMSFGPSSNCEVESINMSVISGCPMVSVFYKDNNGNPRYITMELGDGIVEYCESDKTDQYYKDLEAMASAAREKGPIPQPSKVIDVSTLRERN